MNRSQLSEKVKGMTNLSFSKAPSNFVCSLCEKGVAAAMMVKAGYQTAYLCRECINAILIASEERDPPRGTGWKELKEHALEILKSLQGKTR